jgi:hypothetical protein
MSSRCIPSLLAVVGFVLAALVADAVEAQAPPDVVVLRDGTMFRGTLVERGTARVVLLLPTGEVREFPAPMSITPAPTSPRRPPRPRLRPRYRRRPAFG